MNPATRQNRHRGLINAVVSVCFVSLILFLSGCDETEQQGRPSPRPISKAEKALPYYNPSGGGRKLTTVTEFKSVMGEPSSTQTINGYAYWYYNCADGVIQVKMIDPAMSGGTLAIDSINDY